MGESILVAVITGVISLTGTIITVIASGNKTKNDFREELVLVKNEVKHLSEGVKEHNNYARRMPVVEEQIKVINHRLDDLERKVG